MTEVLVQAARVHSFLRQERRERALLQVEDQGQGLTDPLHLIEGQEAGGFGEAIDIDRRELVAHDQGRCRTEWIVPLTPLILPDVIARRWDRTVQPPRQ